MARFKGKAASRPDLVVPVALAAVLLVALVFLIWFFVDRTGFTIYWNSLGAAVHR
jgi:hypothetical protein